jgi:hypothetical protein
MKTRAVRLHGKRDLRLEELDLPPIREADLVTFPPFPRLAPSMFKKGP